MVKILRSGDRCLLFLTTRPPFPPTSGRKSTLFDYCRYFKEHLGYRVVVAAWPEKGPVSEKPGFIDAFHHLELPKSKESLRNILAGSLLSSRWPMQTSLYFSKQVTSKIDDIIKEEKPSLVMADMIRTAPYLMSLDLPKILDLDDVLSIRYTRQLEAGVLDAPYGKLKSNARPPIKQMLNNKSLNNWIVRKEISLLSKFEIEAIMAYDATVVVSPVEANYLTKLTGRDGIFSIPPAANEDLLTRKREDPDSGTIVFVGVMDVTHNETAVLWFYTEVLPLLKKNHPGLKFFIVGDNPPESIRNLESDSSITVTGRVESIYPYLDGADLLIAPLRFGSGIKIKILEAMAAGVPVVTTSIGAEGLGIEPGCHMGVEDTPEGFAVAVTELLASRELREQRSLAGRQFLAENFRYETLMRTWADILKFIGLA